MKECGFQVQANVRANITPQQIYLDKFQAYILDAYRKILRARHALKLMSNDFISKITQQFMEKIFVFDPSCEP